MANLSKLNKWILVGASWLVVVALGACQNLFTYNSNSSSAPDSLDVEMKDAEISSSLDGTVSSQPDARSISTAATYKNGHFSTVIGVNATQTIAHGLGRTPKLLLLWTAGENSTGLSSAAKNPVRFSLGVTDQNKQSMSVSAGLEAEQMTAARTIDAKALKIIDGTKKIILEAAVTSWDEQNIILNYPINDTVAHDVQFVVISGPNVSSKLVTWTMPLTTGSKEIMGLGFAPEVVLNFHAGNENTSAAGTIIDGAELGLGAMDAQGVMWSMGLISRAWDNAPQTGPVGDPNEGSWGQSAIMSRRAQFSDATLISYDELGNEAKRAVFGGMTSDGFSLNFSKTDAVASAAFSLALKGVEARLGTFNKANVATQELALLGLSSTPQLLLAASVGTDQSYLDADWRLSWGVAAADNSGQCAVTSDENGVYQSDLPSSFLATDNSNSALPAVKAFSDGSFVIAWMEYTHSGDDNFGIYAQRFDAEGTKVGTAFHVNTTTAYFQENPSVATFPDGKFAIVWEHSKRDAYPFRVLGIYGQRYLANGQAEGTEFQINTYSNTINYSNSVGQSPELATSSDGKMIVLWNSLGQNNNINGNTHYYGVFAQRYLANGQKDGSEMEIKNEWSVNNVFPEAAYFSDGRFIVAWEYNSSAGAGLTFQRFTSSGIKDGAQISISCGGYYCLNSSVATLSNGSFLVSWTVDVAYATAEQKIQWQKFDANGVAQGTINTATSFITKTSTVGEIVSDHSRIITWPDGQFAVAWTYFSTAASPEVMMAGQRYQADGTLFASQFSLPRILLNSTNSNVRFPFISAFPDGRLLLAAPHGNNVSVKTIPAIVRQTSGLNRPDKLIVINSALSRNRAAEANFVEGNLLSLTQSGFSLNWNLSNSSSSAMPQINYLLLGGK